MSFDLFLQWYADGRESGVPETTVAEVFGKFLVPENERTWRLQYDARNSAVVFLSRVPEGKISSLCINRPCADARLWEALYRLLSIGDPILFWPGGGPVAAHPLVANHLPADVLQG